jgi:folylpolyglutamate synthase/dihydropteroate synthase
MLADKDWRAMAGKLAPRAEKIFTVPVASARTAAAAELAAAFRTANPAADILACRSLRAALTAAAREKWIVVAGSLYLIGEALEQLGELPADGGERGLNEWSPGDKQKAS